MKHPERHDQYQFMINAEKRPGRIYPPQQTLFFTADLHPLWLCDHYHNATAVLVCGGPSARPWLRAVRAMPGVSIVAMNNAAQDIKPDIWIGLDEPHRFLNRIWLDPTVMKFFPLAYSDYYLRDTDRQLSPVQCPNTVFLRRNDRFNAETFFTEDTVNWGEEGSDDTRGGRSTMVAAIRVLYALGFRKIYLVGADFHMKEGQGAYSHNQAASETAARRNNNLFRFLNQELFPALKPELDRVGLEIINTNPDSKLDVFPKVTVEEAFEAIASPWKSLSRETSDGLYDGHYDEPEPEPKPDEEVSELDRIDAWRWSHSLAQLQSIWDEFMKSRRRGAPNQEELRDRAYCAAGVEPLHGVWSPPPDTPVVKQYPHSIDFSGKTVAVVGRCAIAPDSGKRIDAHDVVVRCGRFRMAIADGSDPELSLGTRTDVWVVDPTDTAVVADAAVMLTKLKPKHVVVLFPSTAHPKMQRRFTELRYAIESEGYPTVVAPLQGLDVAAEAMYLVRGAEAVTTYGITSFIGAYGPTYWGAVPKAEPSAREIATTRMLLAHPNITADAVTDFPRVVTPPGEGIPGIMHWVWLGSDVPGWMRSNIEQAAKMNPGAETVLWDDVTAHALCVEFGLAEAYDDCELQCQRADLVRYCALHKYGGVYIDADFWVIGNLFQWNAAPTWMVPHPPSERFKSLDLNNAIIGARKGAEPLSRIIAACHAVFAEFEWPDARARYGPVLLRDLKNQGKLNNVIELSWHLFYAVDAFDESTLARIKSGKVADVLSEWREKLPWPPGEEDRAPVAIHVWDHFGVGHRSTHDEEKQRS